NLELTSLGCKGRSPLVLEPGVRRIELMAPSPILTVDNLTKRYKETLAVDRVSFEVAAGEVFALIGPNGAGKSTTLRMIATLLTPTSGTITVDGHDRTRDAAAVRRAISYLPEEA